MTSSQNSNDETLTTVSLTITDLTVSGTREERTALLNNLEDHVEKLLAMEFDQSAANVEVQAGHQYATVSPTCPDCDEPLDLRDIHLGDSTDAFALARCSNECGWTGDAVFKLADLDQQHSTSYESSVLSGEITPCYQSYRSRGSDPANE